MVDPSEKAFRTIESRLDQTLRDAREALTDAEITITDRSDRSGREFYNWSHCFEWLLEADSFIHRAVVCLSFAHPWTDDQAPLVTLECRAEIFQRASSVNLRDWRASSAISLAELTNAHDLVRLICTWISKGRSEIGLAP